MKIYRKIQFKITCGVLIIAAASFLFLGHHIIMSQKKQMMSDLELRGQQITAIAAQNSIQLIQSFYSLYLHRMLKDIENMFELKASKKSLRLWAALSLSKALPARGRFLLSAFGFIRLPKIVLSAAPPAERRSALNPASLGIKF